VFRRPVDVDDSTNASTSDKDNIETLKPPITWAPAGVTVVVSPRGGKESVHAAIVGLGHLVDGTGYRLLAFEDDAGRGSAQPLAEDWMVTTAVFVRTDI
jgi:hypothetical protein